MTTPEQSNPEGKMPYVVEILDVERLSVAHSEGHVMNLYTWQQEDRGDDVLATIKYYMPDDAERTPMIVGLMKEIMQSEGISGKTLTSSGVEDFSDRSGIMISDDFMFYVNPRKDFTSRIEDLMKCIYFWPRRESVKSEDILEKLFVGCVDEGYLDGVEVVLVTPKIINFETMSDEAFMAALQEAAKPQEGEG